MKLNLKSKKVLIVEDHPTMRTAIREMLYTLDVQDIVETPNGSSAITAMKKERFDIVLCDYNLGKGKNGQQVLEEARYRRLLPQSAIFIMVTAEQNQSMVLGAMESKPDEYLTKPFNAQQLMMRIERNHAKKTFLADIEQAIDAGNYSAAIAHCERKLEENNRKMHLHLLKIRAELAINTGDFKKAESIYREVLMSRELYWARLGLGIIAYWQSDYPAAIDIFQQLTESQPMMLETYDWLAKAQEANGSYLSAEATLDKATRLSPQAILRQKKLAVLADKTGHLEVAEKAYRSAVNLGKNSVYRSSGDFSGLAKVYSKVNNSQAALKTLKDMREEYINDPEAELRAVTLETEVYQQIGDEALSQHAYETAQQLCQKLGDKVPNDLRLDMIKTHYLKGNDASANAMLEQLIKNNIDDEHFIGDVQNMLGSIGSGHRADSLIGPIKQALIEINNKGVDLFKQGRLIEAMRVFEEAAELMPENKTILTNMINSTLSDYNATRSRGINV
ncbi:MAG: response regulator [Methylomicrobium sp.]